MRSRGGGIAAVHRRPVYYNIYQLSVFPTMNKQINGRSAAAGTIKIVRGEAPPMTHIG